MQYNIGGKLLMTKENVLDNFKGVLSSLEQQKLTAGNWNEPDDNYTEMFILQNLSQFWLN